MALVIKCKSCEARFVQNKKRLAVCPKCYGRITRGAGYRGRVTRAMRQYDLSRAEVEVLVEKCVNCGVGGVVEIHHIRARDIGGKNGFDNCIGLCPNCHALIHKRGVPLHKLLWCGNKSVFGVKQKLLAEKEKRVRENTKTAAYFFPKSNTIT